MEKEILGVLVSSDQHMEHLLGICRAVRASGRRTKIFLTNRGVLLVKDPRFQELEECPEVSLCNVNFEAFELEKPVPLVADKDFATQARHGMLIEDCDRYIVL
jgi:hypothetical protein